MTEPRGARPHRFAGNREDYAPILIRGVQSRRKVEGYLMTDENEGLGIDVEDAIGKIKYALTAAQLQVGSAGLPFKLGSIDLELKVVQSAKNTFKPKFKIPVVDLELGTEVNVSTEQTQVLKVSLAPPPEPTAELLRDAPPIDIPLTAALLEIAGIVGVAGEGEPGLVLGKDGASVSLQVAFASDGSLSLLVWTGKLSWALTSTLTVKLIPLN